MTKQLMFRAEVLGHQMDQIEQQLANADKQAAEITDLREALQRFSGLKEGDEMLVPLAAGIFAKSSFSGEQVLMVNVGAGVVVPKAPAEVAAMLDEQLRNLRAYQQQLHEEFDRMLVELQEIQKKFEE